MREWFINKVVETEEVILFKVIKPTNLDSVKRWSALLGRFLSIQILVQAISLCSGILLVRKLPQKEYAFFTLANSMQATVLLLADIGLMNALSASGGKFWQDRERFGSLIVTGLTLRKQLARISIIVVMPIMLWMLVSRGAGYGYGLIVASVVLFGVTSRITNDILTVVPRLHARIDRLQKLDFSAAVIRLIVVSVGCVTYINTALAVLATSVTYWFQGFVLRQWAADGANLQAEPNDGDRQAIWRIIRQQAPSTIYYCIQGQLVVFLIAIFGSIRNVAEVGALGRLSVIFTLIGSVMSSIVVPRFARCQEKTKLIRIFSVTIIGLAMFGVSLIFLSIVLPEPFLWILGNKYSNLQRILPYSFGVTVSYTIAGAIYGLNASRGWTKRAWISIPITVISQLLMVPFLNLNKLQHVMLLDILPVIVGGVPYFMETVSELKNFNIANASDL